ETLRNALEKDPFYTFVYRLMIDGKPLYHKLRATLDQDGGHPYFLIGIRNVDAAFRQDKKMAEKLSSMHDKEITHLEAILASAEGYLEANLTKDAVLEISPYATSSAFPESYRRLAKEGLLAYSAFIYWYTDNMVTDNRERFAKIGERQYLIDCFEKGEKRASVSFSVKAPGGSQKPCKIVYYIYQDASGDIMSFCVLYDLTEQQRKEKELRELEEELQRIRLRNFTSQMQPHFLYNTLGSIQEIILEDPEYACQLLGDFTIHLRSCIRAMSNDHLISFEEELKNIQAYVNIEKMRLKEKLQVIYDIGCKDFLILPLSVQPLVENAIRHGIYQRGKQGGHVWIQTRENEDHYQIVIRDDGIGFDVPSVLSQRESDSTGLKNTLFRLNKILHAHVDIQSMTGQGTGVTITIPKEKTK
ncbi:MAG: histidine kinase, partial [Erysipelotrichaceae bacterium]|nr:histidine kinase [Erysipelotrichaceae bacterium]